MKSKSKQAVTVPSREDLLSFIRSCDTPPTRREIARAFHLRGADKIALKALLKELERAGEIEGRGKGEIRPAGTLPPVTLVEITGTDADGELLAKPCRWTEGEAPPRIYMAPERKGRPALKAGDRVLARLTRNEDDSYEGRTIRVLGALPRQVLGVYQSGPQGGRLRPTDKRNKTDYIVKASDTLGARPEELVLAAVKPHHPRFGLREVTVVERLGSLDDTRALSLIAIHEHGLPTVFSDDALAEAEAAGPAPLGDRVDLRMLDLVTIDGADARDFDDAVWAEPDPDPKNPGGWHLIVAIADVAHYVPSDSALDRDARERGNSCYFPDRVVPMLPEALSNGWCSLVPGEDRPCMAAHLWLDPDGALLRHRFERGLMRSKARLTYESVQAARDGQSDAVAESVLPALAPLYGAFEALSKAREARGTLDLDLPEPQVLFDAKGEIEAIRTRERLDSHRLIEEFMIAANVAAAETLEAQRQPCMYRIHEPPDPQKIEALRESIDSLGLRLAKAQVMRPAMFNQILKQVRETHHEAMINELVLRSQSQAAYAPDNVGHFGLALSRYAHFTSPIRRYSDLMVHRALITGLRLGAGGLSDSDLASFASVAEHISGTERRAQLAERDTLDRFTAAYLKRKVGDHFSGRIRGVTRFGLFIEIPESAADGLVPVSSLPDDFYDHDEQQHCLVGRRWGRSYSLGETVEVQLKAADPLTGGLLLELVDGNEDDRAHRKTDKTQKRGVKSVGKRPASRGKKKPRKSAKGRPKRRK